MNKLMNCCKVEAVISVDERGQTILPKEVREKFNIKAGDKLAVVSFDKMGCCSGIILLKAADLEENIKEMLGPLAKG